MATMRERKAMKRKLAKLSHAQLVKRLLHAESLVAFVASVNTLGLSVLRTGKEA